MSRRVTFHATTPIPISVTVNGRAPTWGNVPPLEIKLALLDAIDKMDTNDLKQLRFESTVHGKSAETASAEQVDNGPAPRVSYPPASSRLIARDEAGAGPASKGVA